MNSCSRYSLMMTRKNQTCVMLRKSFKSFTGLKKTVGTKLIQELMGYDLSERSKSVQHISEQKWIHRCERRIYRQNQDLFLKELDIKNKKAINLCKNMPKSMVKYLNMQTCLCPDCKRNGTINRCSVNHMMEKHNIKLDTIHEIVEDSKNEEEDLSIEEGKERPSRNKVLNLNEKLIEKNVLKMNRFLSICSLQT